MSRAEFEKWASEFKGVLDLPLFTIKNADGTYADGMSQMAWLAWQASRATIVVQLPTTYSRALLFNDGSMDHSEYFEPDDIHDSLKTAGVSYE